MKRQLWIVCRLVLAAALMWLTAYVCLQVKAPRSTSAMTLLLGVLAIATLGDAVLGLVTAASATLAFSYYFIDVIGTLEITTLQGGINFAAMSLTALIGSQLSARAQRRAAEAEHRREEIERLNQLGRVLLSAGTLQEAGENAVRKLAELFELESVVLKIEGVEREFRAGNIASNDNASHGPAPDAVRAGVAGAASPIVLNSATRGDTLEIWGRRLSDELRNAIASMISLVLERARSSEARARIESTRRGEELRSTILNALAHNFKTPLTSIKIAASALRVSESLAAADDRELAAVIDEEADRLTQMIRESLDLAKMETYGDPRREECRIAEVLHAIASKVTRYLGRREFVIEVADNVPPIMGDRFLLEQMLIQVVDNAWKYSKPRSRIRVSAGFERNEILIAVRNEGNEIPECERALIFDRFYRGTRDRSRIEGTGLGLAIAKTIVEAYQGRVWLDMEPDGPAFHFALPMGAASSAPPGGRAADALPEEATGIESDRETHDFAGR